MKIEFADKRINQFYEAGFVALRENMPFEVSQMHGNELTDPERGPYHVFEGGERVQVFKQIMDAGEKAEAKAEAKRLDKLPDNVVVNEATPVPEVEETLAAIEKNIGKEKADEPQSEKGNR